MFSAVVLMACLGAAAEPPPVPDPIGLGERLALIDHLKETYGIAAPPGESLEQLRDRYRKAWKARQGTVEIIEDAPAAAASDADLAQRIRRQLRDRWHVEAPEEADLAELRAIRDRHLAEDANTTRVSVLTSPSTPAAEPPVANAKPNPIPSAKAKPASIDPPPGAASVRLIAAGQAQGLIVGFGTDHNGAFRGLPEALTAVFATATAINRAVFLLGHGDGNLIGGTELEAHLKANRAYYETLGGAAPQARIDCLVFASCSAHSQVQMRAMRDGLGYYPTWRVATGDRAFANAASVLAAFGAVAARPAKPAYRGIFRFRTSETVASFGEVGEDGERANLEYFRIILDEKAVGGFRVEEQR